MRRYCKRLVVILRLMAVASIFLSATQHSSAMEQPRVFRGALLVEGKFEKGDYERLREFLANKNNFDKIHSGVFLASPGGYIGEAIKIGRLIRSLRLSTDGPSGPPAGPERIGSYTILPPDLVKPSQNYLCASACFLVYVAGINRKIAWAGRLGIHRPAPMGPDGKFAKDAPVGLVWRMHDDIRDYLAEMDVPGKYVDLMYSVPPASVRWITQNELDADLRGFVPEVRDWVTPICGLQDSAGSRTSDFVGTSVWASGVSARTSAKRRDVFTPTRECWLTAKPALRDRAWHSVFEQR